MIPASTQPRPEGRPRPSSPNLRLPKPPPQIPVGGAPRGVPDRAGAGRGDSRVSHVDSWGDLVAGLAREAVAAAAVREQVVQILHRELERAGHGGGRALHAGAAASKGRTAGSAGPGLRSRDPPRPAPEAGPPGAGSGGVWAVTRDPFPGSTHATGRRADARKTPGPVPRGRNAATVEFFLGG